MNTSGTGINDKPQGNPWRNHYKKRNDKYGRNATIAKDYTTPDELRMEWAEAVTTIDEVISVYTAELRTPASANHDPCSFDRIQRAWETLQRGV